MNTSSEPRRCPACSAEIPVAAPQGLCPKCLLLGVASVAESSGLSEVLDPVDSDLTNERRPVSARARSSSVQTNDPRQTAPSVEELAAAFPQLEIIELVGRGGMGFVYKARQPKLDRLVALKILPGHLADEPSFHERFEREARVLAKLQHPLIVGVYDFGEAAAVKRAVGWDQRRFDAPAHQDDATRPDGGPALEASLSHPTNASEARSYFYLMLEFVDGVNLREAMRAGRFTPDQALAIVPQVCEALQYAHSKGVLHRDIKPENILLDTDGRVKIADFGIAKVFDPTIEASSNQLARGGASESELAVTRLTATGSVLGTPLYMAPEQLISPNAVDHRADIFSLGVVFYEMLTGELPMGRFARPSEKSLANQQIDQRIDEVVLRALAKERELRQQSAGEMKTEVETISSTPRPSPVPPPVPGVASPRQSPNRSSATGGSSEPPVNAMQTAEPIFPRWLLMDVGRVLLALFVVSFLSVAIPLVLMIVTSPIWVLDLILFQSTTAWVEHIYQPWQYARDIGKFIAVILCVVVDAALLTLIWRRWLRHVSPRRVGASLRWLFTPYSAEKRDSSGQTDSTTNAPRVVRENVVSLVKVKITGEQSPSPVPLGATRSIWLMRRWRMLLAIGAAVGALVVLDATRMLLERWSNRSPMASAPPVDEQEVAPPDNPFGHDHGTDGSNSRTSGRVSYRNDSAAETEAKRLGLIRAVDSPSGVFDFQQPIGLKGDAGEIFVEPHFSALVRLPEATNRLTYSFKHAAMGRQSGTFDAEFPCDYIACDWTAGTDKPRIMGYMLPPGAYDFRADAETTQLLNEMDSAPRAKIAEDTLSIIRAAALKTAATESDWQQGTQAAHMRFKFVPKAISKLSVPDECLVVLTEKSRSLFTRSGGNFTKHEFVTDNYIRELRESMKPAVIANDVEIVDDSPADATSPENIPR